MNETNLHEYQKACVQHIIRTPFCGIFLEMGLGKTVSTLTAINELKFYYMDVEKVLVIAPKRVVETVWEEEASKWDHLKHLTFSKIIGNPQKRMEALKKDVDIYIVSRDNVEWLVSQYRGYLPYDMVVVDELSSFKSHSSNRFKALKMARPTLKRFVGLTGTPAPNSLIDLWPQIWLMDMGARLGRTISMYRNRFFKPGRSNGYVVYNYVLLPNADKVIHQLISDICISMKAEDYLKMPKRTDNFISIQMPDALQKSYIEFEKTNVLEMVDSLGESKEVSALNAAGLSNKLLQFANGAIYNEREDGTNEVNEIHDLKIDALREIVEESNGNPILVAIWYKFDKDRIMEKLKEFKPRYLKTAQDIKDWNEGKIQLMIAHPASAGHGLNLQSGGNIIVWYGLTWSLELYQQFNARLYRQGQTKPVIIHHLVMRDTHDEDVVLALRKKDEKQNNLMDSIKARISKYIKNL